MNTYNHLFNQKQGGTGSRTEKGSAHTALVNPQPLAVGITPFEGFKPIKLSFLILLLLGCTLFNAIQLNAQTLDWNTFAGSTGTGLHDGSAVVTDASGNIYVCGSSNATFGTPINAKSGLYDGILVKYNSSGVRQWHTFFGGSGDDFAFGIDLDPSGNIYISGSSAASWGTPLNGFSGDPDGLVIKFNSSGVRQWHTFFGAGFGENGYAIAVDASGNAYVTGNSQNDWGSPVEPYTGGTDGIVLKYNTSGARLWHSYFGGGNNSDRGQGIALDASNNVYVTGYSGQSWGSPIVAPAGGLDGILAKYNGSTGALIWNTYFGSSLGDEGRNVELDASGNIYVTGQSAATWGTPINAYSSAIDGALVKFNSSGVRQWNTFLGGTGDDIGYGITVDGSNNIYVSGSSTATWGTPVNAYSSGGDGFVARYNTSGARQSNTFFGGSGLDYASAVTLDASDNVVVAASSDATWGTPVNAYAGSAGSQNMAVVKFNAATPPTAPGGVPGALVWLKANEGTSTSTGNQPLTTWTNQAGPGDATQTVVENKPIYRNGNTTSINFNPVVQFNAASSQFFDLTADIFGDGTARTAANMFTVVKHASIPTTGSNSLWWESGSNGRINQHFPNSGGGIAWDAGGFGTGERLFLSATTADLNTTNPYLWSFLADGTNQSVKKDNAVLDSRTDAVIDYNFTNTSKYIGRNTGTVYFDGNVGEIIGYGTSLTATQIQKIESYLAIKYGMTLDQTTPTNYLASDGSVFWNATSHVGYKANIAGIARDDASGLNQKQSQSVNPGLQVTIGNGNTIAGSNILNTNNFTADKSALIWGNNPGSGSTWTITSAPSGKQILNRVWRVMETGTVGSVKVQISDNSGTDGLPAESVTVYLLVKSSNNDFSTGATEIPMTLVGTNWEANVNFTTLNFFTFATEYNCIPIPARGPLAITDEVTTPSNTTLTINALANDSFVTSSTVAISTAPLAAQGTATVSGTNIIFKPNPTFNGLASFQYSVTNTNGSDIATVYVDVTNVPVVANNDNPAGANSGVTQTVNVKANDVDENKAALTVTIVTPPNGSATVNASGNIVYTPAPGFSGTDVLVYQACETQPSCGTPNCDTALVTLTVNNRPPVGNPDIKTIPICNAGTINLLANDTDPEGDNLTVTSVGLLSNPAAGALVNNNDGTVTFTPAASFIGSVTFTYSIKDNGTPNATAGPISVTINVVNPPNTAPVAVNDAEETNMNQVLYTNVRDNDSDPDNHPLDLPTITTAPLHGTATVNSINGLIEYIPATGYVGTDILTYQVCDIVTVTPATCAPGPGLCSTATLSITIVPPAVQPFTESVTVPSATGGTLSNIAANDKIGGAPATLGVGGNATVATVDTWPTSISLNTSTGNISIAPGTAPGSYSVTYLLCNTEDPARCATMVDLITVTASIAPVTESTTVSTSTGGTLPNIASNDKVNSFSATLGATGNATVATVGSWPSGITLNPATGNVSIALGTTPGTYSITYQLCDKLTPVNCATMVDQITVTGNISPVTESTTVSTSTGGTLPNIALNDQVNGSPATLGATGNATVATVGSWPSGITLNPATGNVSIAVGTTPGTYSITYQLCDKLTPVNCATMVDQITVTASIAPVTESTTVSTSTGGTLPNIASNDKVNSFSATLGATGNATVATVGSWPSGITLNPATGNVSIAVGTTPGTYSITYQLCDKLTPVNCATMVDQITVTGNISPVTESTTVSTSTGGTLPNIALNDQVNGSPATLGATGNATVATVGSWPSGITLNPATGNVSIAVGTTPGTYSITYQLCDKLTPVNCATMVDQITVTSAPPVAQPDIKATPFNTPTNVTILANDSDRLGNPASLTNVTLPVLVTVFSSGTASINPTTGVLSYTPNAGFTGTDVATYRICDLADNTKCSSTTVTIVVDSKSPVAVPDSQTTSLNQPTTVCVLANDNDKNGNPASLTNVTAPVFGQPASGTVTAGINDCLVFTPAPGFTGPVTFTYTICDLADNTQCSTTTVSITVNSAPPVARPDSKTTTLNTPTNVTILANDSDRLGNPASLTNVTLPVLETAFAIGTASINPTTGVLSYTPNAGFTGTDVATYRICDLADNSKCSTTNVTITVLPAPPLAVNDVANTRINTPVSGNVLTNDTDPQGLLPLTVSVLTPVTVGSVTLSSTGNFVYSPPTGFTGVASFCYTASNTAGLSDTACVTITVVPDPVVGNDPPVATNDNTQTNQGVPVTVVILANDSDPDSPTSLNGQLELPTLLGQPVAGTAVVNPNGTVTYSPPVGLTGTVSFPYQICDKATPSLCATAVVTVEILPTPPVGQTLAPVAVDDALLTQVNTPKSGTVSSNDSDPNTPPLSLSFSGGQPTHGSVVLSPNGSYTYTPTTDYSGPDSFTYLACNTAGLCDKATVTIVVLPKDPMSPPLAVNDVVNTRINTPVSGNVLTNDTDPQGLLPLTVSVLTPVTVGSVTLSSTGTFVYSPPTGFTGVASFCYTASNTAGLSDTACVTITVVPDPVVGNDPPVATNDNTQTNQGVPVTVVILANDTDPDSPTSLNGQLNLPTLLGQPVAGTAVVNPNGTVTYSPPVGLTGTVSFPYQVCDKATPSLCATALVTVEILPTPPVGQTLAPVAVDDALLTQVNTPKSGTVSSNDSDPNTPPLSLSFSGGQPTHGSVVLSPNGSYTYTPTTDYSGPDSFTYLACNTAGLCDKATVTIVVLPKDPMSPPLAVNDVANTRINTPVPGNVLTNDTDPQGLLPLTVSVLTPVTVGSVTLSSTGTFVYSPPTGFTGVASFCYTASNTAGLSDTACVTITVVPDPVVGNDPPVATNDNTQTNQGVPVTVVILANDTDPDSPTSLNGQLNLPTLLGQPVAGTAVVNPNGTVTYSPPAGLTGTVSFPYQVCDKGTPALCATAVVTVEILPTPPVPITLAPVAVDDALLTQVNTPKSGTVSSNDSDPNTPPLSLSFSGGQPTHGSVVLSPNGSYTYTPTTDYSGPDSFTYLACNTAGLCDKATVTIVVLPDAVTCTTPTALTLTPTSVTLLEGQGIILTALGGTPGDITWSIAPTTGISPVASGTGTPTNSLSFSTAGIYTITFVSSNSASPVGCALPQSVSAATTLTVLPSVTILSPYSETITNTNPPISGTATPGSSVTVSGPNGQRCIVVATTPGGSWTCTSMTFTPGPQIVTAITSISGLMSNTAITTFTVVSPGFVSILPRVYLQGALYGVYLPDQLMRDDLRQQGYLPTTSPYTAWLPITTTGSVSTAVFSNTGANAIVDWVFVELRSSANNILVVDSRAALLQRDGDIVEIDGVSPLTFPAVQPGNYFVVVRHRNHLAVMSQTAIPVSTTTTVIDFRLPSTPTFTYSGTTSYTQVSIDQAQVVVEQGVAMWAGNAFNDNNPSAPNDFVIYQGTDNDVNVLYQQVINPAGPLVTPFTIRKGYFNSDINLDGKAIFQGTQNDVEFIYQNVIKNHPGNLLVVPFFKIREQKP